MQKLGKSDFIILTHVGSSGRLLHRTMSGYQFGTGNDAKIVESVSELEEYDPHVRAEVSTWLSKGGKKEAEQAMRNRDVAEAASELPGTLDALAEMAGPDIKANLIDLLRQAIKQATKSPVATGEEVKTEPAVEGILISKPGQPKQFVPAENIGEQEDGELVAVGGMSDDIDNNRETLKRRGPGRPKANR